MTAVEMKNEFGYAEVAAEDLCRASYLYPDDDDDIICLDNDVVMSPSSPSIQNAPPPEPEPSQVSRLLLQIVRLHLSEQCISPGCSAVLAEAQKLRKKLVLLEELSSRLRRVCTSQQSEIAKLNEEAEKQKKKITTMESIIKRQTAAIRDVESQLNFMQRTALRPLSTKQTNYSQQKIVNSPQTLNRPVQNNPRQELPVMVQRRVRSEVHLPSAGVPPLANSHRQSFDQTPQRPNGMAQAPSQVPRTPTLSRMLQTPSRASQAPPNLSRMPQIPVNTPSPQTPQNVPTVKSSRVKLEIPFANEKSLINFYAPIAVPTLDYPLECQRCKLAGPNDLSLEIKTEPSNFLLTKKVQGVIKCSSMKPSPKKVRIFCYLESAIKVRRWTSSLLYNFATAEKIKFEIIFSKEQQVSRYDRVVAFAYGTFGAEKYVTDRIVFNVQSANYVNESQVSNHGGSAPQCVEPMDTSSVSKSSPGRNGINAVVDDSNFEVYRPC